MNVTLAYTFDIRMHDHESMYVCMHACAYVCMHTYAHECMSMHSSI